MEVNVIMAAPPAPPPTDSSSAQGNCKKSKGRLLCGMENCAYSTPSSKDLARHMRKHTGDKPYKCSLCPKSYSRSDKLTIHRRVHMNDKIFKCEVCDYSTADSWSLRKHVRGVHNNERPYKCKLCPYAAKESSQLVVHVRTHTGDHPYTCMVPGCDAAFKTQSDLLRHSRTHTKEKPYACPHCGYRAAVKCNLNIHVRKIHKDINEKEEEGQQTVKEEGIVPPKRRSKKKPKQGDDPLTDPDNEQITDTQPHPEEEPSASATRHEDFHPTIDNSVLIMETPSGILMFSSNKGPTSPTININNNNNKKSVIKKPVGRPRNGRKTVPQIISPEQVFDCSFCKASFVSKDSLRCHLRQHASASPAVGGHDISEEESIAINESTTSQIETPSPPFQSTHHQSSVADSYLNFLSVASSSNSSVGGGGLFTSSYPNLNFNATTTLEQKVDAASDITENPRHNIFL